jgi:hypothetical protein
MRRVSILLCFTFLLAASAFAQNTCTASGDPGIAICLPENGSSPLSPIHIQIGTNDSSARVTFIEVYYNHVKRWANQVASADFYLAAQGHGPYTIVAKAHDTAGRAFETSVSVDITNSDYVCNPEQIQNQAPHTIVLCQPTDGEVHKSPVHVAWNVIPETGTTTEWVKVFVDGVQYLQTPPAKKNGFPIPDVDLPMSLGFHRVAVKALDGSGVKFEAGAGITVSAIHLGCQPPTGPYLTFPDINFCSLSDGQTVTGGIALIRSTAVSHYGVHEIQVWVDGVQEYVFTHAWTDFAINLTNGQHTIKLLAYDWAGNSFSKSVNITMQ